MRLDAANPGWSGRAGACTLIFLLMAACVGDSGEQGGPDRGALQRARADSVLRAEAEFDPSAFDTIGWNSPDERLERGAVVWSFSCRKCHGEEGLGDGDLARVEELTMPAITAADWEYAGDVPAVRRRIYVGHETEMPSWGLYGLKYRDIDAVAFYIEDGLRAGR